MSALFQMTGWRRLRLAGCTSSRQSTETSCAPSQPYWEGSHGPCGSTVRETQALFSSECAATSGHIIQEESVILWRIRQTAKAVVCQHLGYEMVQIAPEGMELDDGLKSSPILLSCHSQSPWPTLWRLDGFWLGQGLLDQAANIIAARARSESPLLYSDVTDHMHTNHAPPPQPLELNGLGII